MRYINKGLKINNEMIVNLHRLIADDFKAEMKYNIVLRLIIKLKYPKSEIKFY